MNMLDKLARLEAQHQLCKRTLDHIAHVIMEFRPANTDACVLDSVVALLEDAGYDMGCTPSEPEDLTHGDSDAGAEG